VALLAWFARLSREQQPGEPNQSPLIVSGLVGVRRRRHHQSHARARTPHPRRAHATLHLFTIMTVLLGGGILGEPLLARSPLALGLIFVPLCAHVRAAGGSSCIPEPAHRMAGPTARNDWTRPSIGCGEHPRDAYFVLGPGTRKPRAKISMIFARWPSGSALPLQQSYRGVWPIARAGPAGANRSRPRQLGKITPADFTRLKEKYGVTWAGHRSVHDDAGLDCLSQRSSRVCRHSVGCRSLLGQISSWIAAADEGSVSVGAS